MTTPAGWYDDGSGRQRWWDGTQWTEHFAPTAAAETAESAGLNDEGDVVADIEPAAVEPVAAEIVAETPAAAETWAAAESSAASDNWAPPSEVSADADVPVAAEAAATADAAAAEIPAVPEIPATVDASAAPEIPATPDIPATPEATVTPESYAAPEVPATPETPATPDVPADVQSATPFTAPGDAALTAPAAPYGGAAPTYGTAAPAYPGSAPAAGYPQQTQAYTPAGGYPGAAPTYSATGAYPGAAAPAYGAPGAYPPAYAAAAGPAKMSIIGLVGLGLAGLGTILSCIFAAFGAMVLGWVLLFAGFVVSIISLFLKGKKWPGIAGLILSVVGTIIAVVMFFVFAVTSIASNVDRYPSTYPSSSSSDDGSDEDFGSDGEVVEGDAGVPVTIQGRSGTSEITVHSATWSTTNGTSFDASNGGFLTVEITWTGIDGTSNVNPLYFAIQTAEGTDGTYDFFSSDQLESGELAAGESVSGPITFDIAQSDSYTLVVTDELMQDVASITVTPSAG